MDTMRINFENLERILAEIEHLPSLPAVIGQLLTRLRNEKSTSEEIGSLIALDPALSAKVLKLANSAYFGQRNEITTPHQAVVVLGFSAIRAIVLGATIRDSFDTGDLRRGYFDPDKYWRHAIASAAAAQYLVELLELPQPEDAFTAGLLHGVGLLVIDSYSRQALYDIEEEVELRHKTLLEAEEELLGFDHGHLGARLLEFWGLPERITLAVRNHNFPDMCPASFRQICSAVHVGQILARMLDHGNAGEPYFPTIQQPAWQTLQIGPEVLPTILEPMDQAIVRANVFLSV